MTPTKEVVETSRVPRLGPYSQAVRVGDLLFTAGQPGIDPKTGTVAGRDFEAQARQAFENLRAVLEDAGSGAQVVRVTCFIADPNAFSTLNALFGEYFPSAPPVRSVPVVSLPKGLLFSIDAIGEEVRGCNLGTHSRTPRLAAGAEASDVHQPNGPALARGSHDRDLCRLVTRHGLEP